MPFFVIHKKLGETPLQALEGVRAKNNIGKEIPMTYAGRLDPAAEGFLIILSGDDVHKKDEYKNLEKIYEVDLIFGLSTDTGDLLGVLKSAQVRCVTKITEEDLNSVLAKLSGTREQKFHSFSSKPVDGLPLWSHMRENNNVEIPSHTITINKISILKDENISSSEIFKQVENITTLVTGDFRQKEILDSWQKIPKNETFQKFTIKVSCSSGTYMRVLAEEIGSLLNSPTLASRIFRKSVGEFK